MDKTDLLVKYFAYETRSQQYQNYVTKGPE